MGDAPFVDPAWQKRGAYFRDPGGWTVIWLIGNRCTTRPGNRVHVRLWKGECARERHQTGGRERARRLKVVDMTLACPSCYTVAWRKAPPSMLGRCLA
jgi:hypothetical protein